MLLEEFGNDLRIPYSNSLGNGIFELRSILGNDITRILYFFIDGNSAVLTNGFTKKTQKTPKNEIDKAIRYRNDYYLNQKRKDG